MLNVYVAAGSTEVARAADIIRRLREAGVNVTYDWTVNALERGDPADGYRTLDRPEEEMLGSVRGVLSAEVVWFLVPYAGSTGAGFELGIAYTSRKVIVCSGPHCWRFFFGGLLVEYETDEEVLEWLIRQARERAQPKPGGPYR